MAAARVRVAHSGRRARGCRTEIHAHAYAVATCVVIRNGVVVVADRAISERLGCAANSIAARGWSVALVRERTRDVHATEDASNDGANSIRVSCKRGRGKMYIKRSGFSLGSSCFDLSGDRARICSHGRGERVRASIPMVDGTAWRRAAAECLRAINLNT